MLNTIQVDFVVDFGVDICNEMLRMINNKDLAVWDSWW